jgi:hypothetical protein
MIQEIDRDQALMWLNDRIGKVVSVALSVDRGGWSIHPIEVSGALKHVEPGLTAEHGDELAGMYTVGDEGGLDLSELPDDAFSLREAPRALDELQVLVGEHAGIGITSRS